MPLVLDGTNGVSGVDGTASNPAIEGTDSNTGIFYPAADTVAIGTGGTEALRVDSSQRLGVGTTSTLGNSLVNVAQGVVARNSGATLPYFQTYNSNAGTDLKTWRFGGNSSGALTFETVNDAYSSATGRMTLDASGRFGIGFTPNNLQGMLQVAGAGQSWFRFHDTTAGWNFGAFYKANGTSVLAYIGAGGGAALSGGTVDDFVVRSEGNLLFAAGGNTERARITSGGNLLVGTTTDTGTDGITLRADTAHKYVWASHNSSNASSAVYYANRQNNDGTLFEFRQADTTEGTISVSGTTVSYNGGHLSRYAQTQTAKDESLLKGTVLSNLDEMNVYADEQGNTVNNEQLNKVKVSDVEGDPNVAGVFVNWSYDEQHQVDEINMAMTGDMIIRIAQGVTVQKGDLLMSAGDGTAKPQGDDIVRSKTVAKVTSNHVTCTYDDGSYCVPCVLMAC